YLIFTTECSKEKDDTLQEKSKLNPPENWICNQCENEISNLFHFIQHLKNHLLTYLGKRFKCEICHMLFRKFDNLKMHLITHRAKESKGGDELSNQNQNITSILKSFCENEEKSKFSKLWKGPFSCQVCLKTYNSAKCLLRHLSKHTGEFYCNLCKKEFSCSQNLKKHICIHRPENNLKCNLCKKAFSSSRLLKFHSIEHNDKLKCSSCSRIFLCENYLEVHKIKCAKESSKSSNCNSKEFSSTEPSRFSCHFCDRNFSSVIFLQNHVSFCKQLDFVNKNGEVSCDVCGDICAGPVELKIHHQTHTHSFLCLNCSQRFRSRGTYDCHICGIDFTCDFCDTKENLRLHECKLETNDFNGKLIKNKVSCPYCPSHFVTTHNLKKHMASLHSIPLKQNFFCGKCGRGFHRSDLLKSHEKVHLEPSFKCLKCPKTFKSQKAFFDLHSVVHNGDFRFVCKLCNKGFTQKKYLNRHEKSHFSTGRSKSTLLKCTHCTNHLRPHMKICSNRSEERHEDRHGDISTQC
ncbi:Zinc finger protein 26, partial [Armadillidium nasatum]